MKTFSIICLLVLTINSMASSAETTDLPEYLAIVAEDEIAEDQTNQFLNESFQTLLKEFPQDADVINNDYSKLENHYFPPWKIPDSWHTTVLYIGQNATQAETPYFKKFTPGKQIQLETFTFVYVPTRIICGPVFPKDVLISNKCPHVTMMMANWNAVASNFVLEALFTNNGPLQSEYESGFFASSESQLIKKFSNLQINNETVDVYLIKVAGNKHHFNTVGTEEMVYPKKNTAQI